MCLHEIILSKACTYFAFMFTLESGFGYLKLEIAGMLHMGDVERIATALNFQPSTRDRLRRSENPSLALLHELESRDIISETDISSLIVTLEKLNLELAARNFNAWFHKMKKTEGKFFFMVAVK